jgi:hypothetical protein
MWCTPLPRSLHTHSCTARVDRAYSRCRCHWKSQCTLTCTDQTDRICKPCRIRQRYLCTHPCIVQQGTSRLYSWYTHHWKGRSRRKMQCIGQEDRKHRTRMSQERFQSSHSCKIQHCRPHTTGRSPRLPAHRKPCIVQINIRYRVNSSLGIPHNNQSDTGQLDSYHSSGILPWMSLSTR